MPVVFTSTVPDMGDGAGQVAVPHIARSVAGLRPWLVALVRDIGTPEQFQFGAGLVWLDLETDTEADVVVAGAGGAVDAVGRTQERTGTAPGAAPIDTVGARCRTLRVGLCSRTVHCVPNPLSIPTHSRAYQKSPRGWHCIGPHLASG